ncbi:MAG TPA: class II fructose-bisphosphate aldolase, partial [Atopobiaceae bacterium]|nr:class II fructose-bisphosphate aldolase [Atopobiaceae bacterium]
MLVNATQMLQSAEKGHYAVGAFNTNNLEWTRSILTAAEELQSPIIVQCTAGAAKWQQGFKVVTDILRDLCDYMKITVPVVMHLDHGSYEDCFKAIEAGFTSIMYDGSHEASFEINLERTAEIVKLCHSKGISVEAEVGGIGGTEDGITAKGELADPAQCKAIADLGVTHLCGAPIVMS